MMDGAILHLFVIYIREKIVGYSLSRTITVNLVKRALKNAYQAQKPSEGLIIPFRFWNTIYK